LCDWPKKFIGGNVESTEMSSDLLCTPLCDWPKKLIGGNVESTEMSSDLLCTPLCDWPKKLIGGNVENTKMSSDLTTTSNVPSFSHNVVAHYGKIVFVATCSMQLKRVRCN